PAVHSFPTRRSSDLGTGEINTVPRGNALEKPVVVGIFKAGLEGIVVNITYGKFGFYPVQSQGIKLEICHGPGGVLGQRLVDPQRSEEHTSELQSREN